MNFADAYFKRYSFSPALIPVPPKQDVELILIIPSYLEDELEAVLRSLMNCQPKHGRLECIVLINAPENDSEANHHHNLRVFEEIQDLAAKTSNNPHWSLHVLLHNALPAKHAGVGLARKILMDEALHRFSQIEKPDGIIVSFDADSYCNPGFIEEIQSYYARYPIMVAANHHFEHPLQGNTYSPEVYKAITAYELYLRYFREAMKMSGFPYYHFTIGSAFSVRASAYMKVGGMNRRKAGEDFYFLHKLMPGNAFGFIPNAVVYPSPRESERVPFGTGKAVKSYVEEKEILCYPIEAFLDLKTFLGKLDSLYRINELQTEQFIRDQEEVWQSFLLETGFPKALKEINQNSATPEGFRKRFFHWFNGLQALRFLNHALEKKYSPIPVNIAAESLLKYLNQESIPQNTKDLLLYYRNLPLDKT